jgi:predicted acetyltransferase
LSIELTIARAPERPVLENLLSLYIHDFSEIFGGTPGPDGRFNYDRLPLYFEEPDRTAFLIRAGGQLAGFALVSQASMVSGSRDVRDLSEFFVVRGLRRRGVGRSAASEVFRRFPGVWEVRALDRNEGASAFWASAISGHTEGAFEVRSWEPNPGRTWKVFRFSQT